MARALENALLQAQPQSRGLPAQAEAFMAAAEDIRRLLHQFAAGFLKEPDPQVLQGANYGQWKAVEYTYGEIKCSGWTYGDLKGEDILQ
jgi:hypothetical protein